MLSSKHFWQAPILQRRVEVPGDAGRSWKLVRLRIFQKKSYALLMPQAMDLHAKTW